MLIKVLCPGACAYRSCPFKMSQSLIGEPSSLAQLMAKYCCCQCPGSCMTQNYIHLPIFVLCKRRQYNFEIMHAKIPMISNGQFFQCVMKNTMNIYVPVEVTVTQPEPSLCVNHLRNIQLYHGYLIMLKPPKENSHYGDAFAFDCVNRQVRRTCGDLGDLYW